MTSKRHTTSAFTLLEILLVILVIGIAAAAFLPTVVGTAENARTRAAIREIIAFNRYARSKAILDRKPVAMVYYDSGDKVQLLSLPARRDPKLSTQYNTSPDESSPDQIELIRNRIMPKFVSVREVTGGESEDDNHFVVYEENGIAPSHSVTILDPKGKNHLIHFNGLTGEVRLEN